MDTKASSKHTPNFPRIRVLHVFFDALNLGGLLSLFSESIHNGRKIVVGHHNLHSVYLCHKNEEMARFYQKVDYVHADGMSLIFLCRLFGHDVSRESRLTSLDWLIPSFAHCQRELGGKLRVFLLGGQPGVAEAAAQVFQKEVAGLEIRCHSGYFDMNDAGENDGVVACVNEFKPHLLLVGMGMPRQEAWVLQNAERVQANVVCSLGAFMDYYAGVIPLPPRWLGPLGLEWLFRLLSEPRRLGNRYLVEPWTVAWLVMKEYLIGGRGVRDA